MTIVSGTVPASLLLLSLLDFDGAQPTTTNADTAVRAATCRARP